MLIIPEVNNNSLSFTSDKKDINCVIEVGDEVINLDAHFIRIV